MQWGGNEPEMSHNVYFQHGRSFDAQGFIDLGYQFVISKSLIHEE